VTSCDQAWTFEVVNGLSDISPGFDYCFIMKLFSVFKKGVTAGGAPPATSDTSHPVDSEVLFRGVDPIIAE